MECTAGVPATRQTWTRDDALATGEPCSTASIFPRGFEGVFHRFDEDGDGKISPAELCACMRSVGQELSLEDAVAAVEYADTDGDGLLGLDDFAKLADAEKEEDRERDLRAAFGLYAMEGLGCITANSLSSALGRLGNSMDADECKVMICRFDLNGDGVISFDEFRAMMAC